MKLITALLIAAPAWCCTAIEGDRILGKHLAAEAPAFASIDANLDLGPAPHAGARRVYRPFELERIAAKHNLAAPTTEACFERATQTLTPEALREVIGNDVEITDYSKNPLPLGELEFPQSGLDPTGLWRGRLLYGDNRSIPVWVRISVPGGAPGIASQEVAVERGETVVVSVIRGGVRLSFESAAETSGHIGESVTIRNPANGKRFRAVVESKSKVVILP